MKYVINGSYGGFCLPNEVAEKLGCDSVWERDYDTRTSPELIEWVEKNPEATDLCVVEIPDEATDWDLLEYDGLEHIVYVIDGKMHYLSGD